MPCPSARYHAWPAGAIFAAAQIASSAVWVPDLSARLAKGAWAFAMAANASLARVSAAIRAGSAAGPTITKSLYMTSNRSRACRSATNWSSASRAWTSSTSASPRRPMAMACPVPTATTSTRQPAARSNAGRIAASSPVSAVLVVVASRRTAGAGAAPPAAGRGARAPSAAPDAMMQARPSLSAARRRCP